MNNTIHSTVLTPGLGYLALSATVLTIGTGSKTLTTQQGLAYSIGARVRISYSIDPTQYMEGVITAWNNSTGVMTVLVDWVHGSGTQGVWDINVAGDVGAVGPAGPTGPQGIGYTPRGAYAGGTTYAQGDEVADGGLLYLALQSANTGHTPASSPTWWLPISGVGLIDPGANGILKRTALNTTAVAAPGADYQSAITVRSTDFKWSATPGGSLIVGSNSIALASLPAGVVVGSNVRIFGGVGTEEMSPISGISGSTITVTCAHTHTGGWSVGTGTAGILEAVISATANFTQQAAVRIPSNVHDIYDTIYVTGGFSIRGLGTGQTVLSNHMTAGDLFQVTGGGAIDLGDFTVVSAPTSGHIIHLIKPGYGDVSRIDIQGAYVSLNIDGNINTSIHDIYVNGFTHRAVWINAVTDGVSGRSMGNYYNWDITTALTGVIAVQIDDPIVGVVIANLAIKQGVVPGNSDVGMQVNLTHANAANLQVLGLLMDGYELGVQIAGQTATPNANHSIEFTECVINSIQAVQVIGQFSSNVHFKACRLISSMGGPAQIPASSDRCLQVINSASHVSLLGCTLDCDGDSAVLLGTCSDIDISGCVIGALQVNGGVNPTNGILITGTVTGLRVVGNPRLYGSSLPINNGGTLAGLVVIRNNPDLDSLVTSIANGATLTLPLGPLVKLTSGTGVTQILDGGFSDGMVWNVVVTSSTAFTLGGNIGNTKTLTSFGTIVKHGGKFYVNGV